MREESFSNVEKWECPDISVNISAVHQKDCGIGTHKEKGWLDMLTVERGTNVSSEGRCQSSGVYTVIVILSVPGTTLTCGAVSQYTTGKWWLSVQLQKYMEWNHKRFEKERHHHTLSVIMTTELHKAIKSYFETGVESHSHQFVSIWTTVTAGLLMHLRHFMINKMS